MINIILLLGNMIDPKDRKQHRPTDLKENEIYCQNASLEILKYQIVVILRWY